MDDRKIIVGPTQAQQDQVQIGHGEIRLLVTAGCSCVHGVLLTTRCFFCDQVIQGLLRPGEPLGRTWRLSDYEVLFYGRRA